MLIQTIIEHKEWSNRIRRRGIGRVAKEAGIDSAYLSRMVNNQKIVTPTMLEKLRVATNKLIPVSKIDDDLIKEQIRSMKKGII